MEISILTSIFVYYLSLICYSLTDLRFNDRFVKSDEGHVDQVLQDNVSLFFVIPGQTFWAGHFILCSGYGV